MKLSQIRHMITVAECGSTRSAARLLGVAQPAITRSIRDLEHELGVDLFERHATGMALTPLGKTFLRRATAIQHETQRATDEIQQLKGAVTGTVTVGLSTGPHIALVPPVLDPFMEKYPAVRLKLSEGMFPAMDAGLRSGTIDFYVGPLAEATLSNDFMLEKLFDNQRIIVGRAGHPLARSRSLADLTGAKWVTTALTLSSEAELGPIFESFGLPAPTVVCEVQTALSMMVVTAFSDCLAMLPRQWRKFAQRSDMLCPFDLAEEIAGPAMYLVRRASLPLTPAAEYLSDLFRRAAIHHRRFDATAVPRRYSPEFRTG